MSELKFTCLDPRKKKRARISRALSACGRIKWKRMAPLSSRKWPEAKREAEIAMAMSPNDRVSRIPKPIIKWSLMLQYNGARAYFEKHNDEVAVCWNGLNGTRRVFMQAAKASGAKTLFFELGPFPNRITVDPKGVNNENSLPRTPAPYLAWFPSADAKDWREIRGQIKQRKALKKADKADAPPLSEPFIFVALQYPGDSQLRLQGGAFRTVEAFISAIGEAANHLPEGWHIRIKEHPSSPHSFADEVQALRDRRVYLDNTNDTFSQVEASKAVVTVNSSVGLESMFYDKPVVACGQCFWAIDGVAHHAGDQSTLNAVVQQPETITFSAETRAAFLTYLDQVYYPHDSDDSDKKLILDRLSGRDEFGFWEVTR